MNFLLAHEHPFHKLSYGGGHQIVRGLAKQLTSLGHYVSIVSSGVDEIGVSISDPSLNFYLTGNCNRRLMGLSTAWLTMKLAFKLKPDWVCCFTSEAFLVVPFCKLIGVKVVVYEAAPDLVPFRVCKLQTFRYIRYRFELFLHFLGAKLSSRVMTISDFTTVQANKNWGIDISRLYTVGAGIEDIFFSTDDYACAQSHRGGIRFISVGRITLNQKPLDIVAHALKLLEHPWEIWTIVGSGPDELRLKEILNLLGLKNRVIFLGMKSSEEIKCLLAQHDIALLPSSHESLFLTAYEAAASRKIIVTNDVADIKKYFHNSPSVIVANDLSPGAFQLGIEEAIKLSSEKNIEIEKTARRVNCDFSWNAVADRFISVLESNP